MGERVVDQELGSYLRVFDVSDQIDRLLIGADIPELRRGLKRSAKMPSYT